jgi:hypothetical protein
MKTQKFFRYLWRANAVLILIAAGAITFGVAVVFGTIRQQSKSNSGCGTRHRYPG